MFSRLVRIDGVEIWVSCTPQTPLSEVLRRAMQEMARRELGAKPSEVA